MFESLLFKNLNYNFLGQILVSDLKVSFFYKIKFFLFIIFLLMIFFWLCDNITIIKKNLQLNMFLFTNNYYLKVAEILNMSGDEKKVNSPDSPTPSEAGNNSDWAYAQDDWNNYYWLIVLAAIIGAGFILNEVYRRYKKKTSGGKNALIPFWVFSASGNSTNDKFAEHKGCFAGNLTNSDSIEMFSNDDIYLGILIALFGPLLILVLFVVVKFLVKNTIETMLGAVRWLRFNNSGGVDNKISEDAKKLSEDAKKLSEDAKKLSEDAKNPSNYDYRDSADKNYETAQKVFCQVAKNDLEKALREIKEIESKTGSNRALFWDLAFLAYGSFWIYNLNLATWWDVFKVITESWTGWGMCFIVVKLQIRLLRANPGSWKLWALHMEVRRLKKLMAKLKCDKWGVR